MLINHRCDQQICFLSTADSTRRTPGKPLCKHLESAWKLYRRTSVTMDDPYANTWKSHGKMIGVASKPSVPDATRFLGVCLENAWIPGVRLENT